MKRTKKTVEKRTYTLQNAFPRFVSIVSRGANFTPFAELRFSDSASFSDVEINSIVFSKDKFETKEKVEQYLQANNYDEFEIVEENETFFVPGLENDKFAEIEQIEMEDGVKYSVGKLKVAEPAEPVGEVLSADIVIHMDPSPANTPDQPPMQGKKLKKKVPDNESPSREAMSTLDPDDDGDDDADGPDSDDDDALGNGALPGSPLGNPEKNDRMGDVGELTADNDQMVAPNSSESDGGINTLKPGTAEMIKPGGLITDANSLKPGTATMIKKGPKGTRGVAELPAGNDQMLPSGGSAPTGNNALKPGNDQMLPKGGSAPNGVGEMTAHSAELADLKAQFADLSSKLEALIVPVNTETTTNEPLLYSQTQVDELLAAQKLELETAFEVKIEEFSQNSKITIDEQPIVIQNKQGLQETKELIDTTTPVVDEQKLKFEQKRLKNLVGLN